MSHGDTNKTTGITSMDQNYACRNLSLLQPFYGSLDFVQDNLGELKEHSPTQTYRGQQSSLICFLHLLQSMASPLFNLRAWQSFSTISVQVFFVYLLAWHPPLHTPYIYSPNCLLFAAHAHTIGTCFAVVPKLCHLILVSLNPLLGTLSCSLMPHIHLTILISACWSATSFSFLTGQV